MINFITFTYFAAFAGVIPPGLVNMAVAKTAVEKDKKNAVYASLGACVVNFLHAFLSILMARYIIGHASVQANMLKIGMVVFIGLAIYFFLAGLKNKSDKSETSKKGSRKSFAKGFFIANLNILPIPYFVLICAQLSAKHSDMYDWLHVVLFSLSAALGTFTILYIYIIAFIKLNKRTNVLRKYANFFMAGLMFVLFIITLLRAYNVGW